MNNQAKDYFVEGVQAYREGEFAKAVKSLSEGLKLEQNHWEMRFFLAMSYGRLEKTREARQEFLSIRDLCPDPEMRKRAAGALSALTSAILS